MKIVGSEEGLRYLRCDFPNSESIPAQLIAIKDAMTFGEGSIEDSTLSIGHELRAEDLVLIARYVKDYDRDDLRVEL